MLLLLRCRRPRFSLFVVVLLLGIASLLPFLNTDAFNLKATVGTRRIKHSNAKTSTILYRQFDVDHNDNDAQQDEQKTIQGSSTIRRGVIQAVPLSCMTMLLAPHSPVFAVIAKRSLPNATDPNRPVNLDCLQTLPPVPDDSVRIYLCRHGQTENNRLRKVQGARVDPPINDNGNIQATNLGLALARSDARPQLFFSSPLRRAIMTAEIAAESAGAGIASVASSIANTRQLASLAEVDFGPFAEGKPILQVQEKMTQAYATWSIGNVDYRPQGGGNSGREVKNRS
jgi:hypothetical protein